jgi:hypothetical protein
MSLHIDLARGQVEGHPVLGRPAEAITCALGPPSYVEHYPVRVDIGYGQRFRPRIEVIVTGTAWSIELEDPSDVDARLGSLLGLAPSVLQARIRTRLAQSFHPVRAYRCDAKGCFGVFASADGSRRLLFGRTRGHTFVSLQLTRHS